MSGECKPAYETVSGRFQDGVQVTTNYNKFIEQIAIRWLSIMHTIYRVDAQFDCALIRRRALLANLQYVMVLNIIKSVKGILF
jgi:hypothetical protein